MNIYINTSINCYVYTYENNDIEYKYNHFLHNNNEYT